VQLIEARKAFADYLARHKDTGAAEAELGRLLDDARRLGQEKSRVELVRAEGDAHRQLGDLLAGRGERAKAAESYDAAASAATRLIELRQAAGEPEAKKGPAPHVVAWLMRMHRLAGEQRTHLNDAGGALKRFSSAIEARQLLQAEAPPGIEQETALVHGLLFLLERQRGNATAADMAKGMALAASDRMLAAASASAEQKRWATDFKARLDKLTAPR
jgi:hypothetical protein